MSKISSTTQIISGLRFLSEQIAHRASELKLKQFWQTFVFAFSSIIDWAKSFKSCEGWFKRKKTKRVAARWPMPGSLEK
jgi:hypothetical protein